MTLYFALRSTTTEMERGPSLLSLSTMMIQHLGELTEPVPTSQVYPLGMVIPLCIKKIKTWRRSAPRVSTFISLHHETPLLYRRCSAPARTI